MRDPAIQDVADSFFRTNTMSRKHADDLAELAVAIVRKHGYTPRIPTNPATIGMMGDAL